MPRHETSSGVQIVTPTLLKTIMLTVVAILSVLIRRKLIPLLVKRECCSIRIKRDCVAETYTGNPSSKLAIILLIRKVAVAVVFRQWFHLWSTDAQEPSSSKSNRCNNSRCFNSDLGATKKLMKVMNALAPTLKLRKESGNLLQIFRLQSLLIIRKSLSSGPLILQILNFLFSLKRLYNN